MIVRCSDHPRLVCTPPSAVNGIKRPVVSGMGPPETGAFILVFTILGQTGNEAGALACDCRDYLEARINARPQDLCVDVQ